MSDRIELTGIRGYGYHGVFAGERANGQDFIVDVALHCDLQAAGRRDDLTSTIDYGDLAVRIHQIIEGEPVNLIEALAERVANEVLKNTLVKEVIVTVHKPSAPITVPFQDVAVTIARRRS